MRRALACLCLAALPVVAAADLDVGIRNRDRVRGTLLPAGEVETFRVDLPRGARLAAVAKPRRTSAHRFPPALRLRLLDPVGRDISSGVAATRGSRGLLTGFEAPETGTYFVEVRGDGFDTGDYVLAVRWKLPRRVREKGVGVSAVPAGVATVAADVGATLRITAKAAKRSGVIPHVVDVVGPGDAVVRAFSPPNPLGPKHRVEATLPASGLFTVRLADVSGAGGQADVDVRVRPPAGGRRDVRVTDDVLGAVPGDVRIVSTVLLDERGGATPGAARVVLPSGALKSLTPVQIGLGETFAGPPGMGLLPAGTPVYVGSESLEFARLIDLVLPYDPDALPDGTGQLRVVRRDAAGLRTLLDERSIVVDAPSATATIPVGRGGTYAAFRRVPPPAPTSVTPFAGSVGGGYEITLSGSGFRDLRDPATGDSLLEILLDGQPVSVVITAVTPAHVAFTAPPHAAGRVTFAVRDPETGLVGTLPPNTFTYQ